MSDDDDSDRSSASEDDVNPDEREHARQYANEDNYQCDMTFFEHATLVYCLELLRRRVDDLSTRIRNENAAIELLFQKELEGSDGDDPNEERFRAIARHRRTIRDLQTSQGRFDRKARYVREKIDELYLSEPDTEIGESWSEGELDSAWGEQSDSHEDYPWGFEQGGIYVEERSESEDGRGLPWQERSEYEDELDDF